MSAGIFLILRGINASQVDPNLATFHHRCLGMYLTVAAVIVVSGPARTPPPTSRRPG